MSHSNPQNSLKNSRALAAFFLGASVSRLFPGISISYSEVDSIGFSYEFISTKQIPINENLLELIEQQMIQLSRRSSEIHLFEMMKENGHTYFCHHGQPFKAEILLDQTTNVVALAKLDHFVDLFYCETIPPVCPFKLVEIEESSSDGEWKLKIYGLLHESKPALKELVKKYRELNKYKAVQLASDLKIYFKSEGEVLWSSKGLTLKKNILDPLLLQLTDQGFEQVERSASFFDEKEEFFNLLYAIYQKKRFGYPYKFYSLLKENFASANAAPSLKTFDCEAIFCTTKQLPDELISSLHFFEQIFKIFGFKYRLCLVENHEKQWSNKVEKTHFMNQTKRKSTLLESILKSRDLPFEREVGPLSAPLSSQPFLDFRRVDALGREESLGWLVISEIQDTQIIMRSCCYTVDQWVDALLEEHKGKLPFWLQPEQVRILTLQEAHTTQADWLKRELIKANVKAFVDSRPLSLSEKIFEVKREKIPFSIILGDQESNWIDKVSAQERSGENIIDNSLIKLAIRALDDEKKEIKTLQNLLEECSELNRSKI